MLPRIRDPGGGGGALRPGSCSLGGRPWRCPWPGRKDGDAGRGGRDAPAEAANQRLPTLSCPGYRLSSNGSAAESSTPGVKTSNSHTWHRPSPPGGSRGPPHFHRCTHRGPQSRRWPRDLSQSGGMPTEAWTRRSQGRPQPPH